jgi:ABC-type bacteriocin/lantibiotic exporter with double-glycine peptidase domain
LETNNQQDETEEEQKEIIKPSAGAGHKFMLDFEPSDLDHSRRELWGWLISYIKPFRWKFNLYLIVLLMGTIITASTPLITASIIDKGIIVSYIFHYYYLWLLLVISHNLVWERYLRE